MNGAVHVEADPPGLCLTVGAGRHSTSTERISVPEPSASALAETLRRLPAVLEGWFSFHRWRVGRKSEDWQSASGTIIDLDHHVQDPTGAKPGGIAAVPPQEWREHLQAVMDSGALPGNVFHHTLHGERIYFLFDAPVTKPGPYRRAYQGACELVRSALVTAGVPVSASIGRGDGFEIDPSVEDLAQWFWNPQATVKGKKRNGSPIVLREDPYRPSDLANAAPSEPQEKPQQERKPTNGANNTHGQYPTLQAARDAYNRDHTEDWGEPGRGTCPAHGNGECFGRLPDRPDRWCCHSSNHPAGVGHPDKSGTRWWGDALDLGAHEAGESTTDHLIRTGYLKKRDDIGCDDDEEPPPPEDENPAGPGTRGAKAPQRDDDPSKEKGAKGAKALLQIVEDAGIETFMDDRAAAYAAVPLPDGGREVVRVSFRSRRFRGLLSSRLYEQSGTIATESALDSAVALLEAQTVSAGRAKALSERFACEGKPAHAIWVDLGDDKWGAVRIDANGWTIERRPPVLFRRGAHTNPLVEPCASREQLQYTLFDFLNVEDDGDRLLLLAWTVAAMFSGVPRAILHFAGLKGTTKTTSARVLRALLDPSKAAVLGAPHKEDALAHQLAKHAVPVYDNLSIIPGWFSDALCRSSTGEAWEKRSLYTDDDSVIVSYQRSIILTGINLSSTAPDLLDRLLLIELSAVKRRRRESEFWAAFDAAKPNLLGSLYDLVSATLAQLEAVRPDPQFRMADFAHIGAAVALAIGRTAADFSAAYARTLGAQTTEILEADPLAVLLRAFMADKTEWDGKVGDLFERLRPHGNDDRHSGFPKTPAAMGKRLRVVLHALADAGIEVKPYDGDRRERRVLIRRCSP